MNASRSVNWLTVHEFVEPLLADVGDWPMAGSVEWCNLPDDDPRKWAAILDASRHHALRMETAQQAHADASRAVSAAADWPQVAREIQQRQDFYAQKPYLRRAAS